MDIKGILFSLFKPAAPSGSVNLPFQYDVNGPNVTVSVSAPVLVGDSGTGGTAGLAPAPAAGDGAAKKWLKATGAWLAIVASDLAGAVFGASGASHSAGAVPDPGSSAGTTRYLREDATWAVPPDTGITQLTGDVTAGPGGGSQAATLPNIVTAGTNPKITYNAKGQVTAGAALSAGDIPNIAESQVTNLTTDLAAKAPSGVDVNSSGQVTATHLASPLPVAQGGTGTSSPGIVAGANVTVTGTWPNQTVASSGGGGGTNYFGQADAVASAGQNTVTFGSTPIAGSVSLFQDGVVIDPVLWTLSGTTATLSANVFATGATILALWQTTSATPGSISLSALATNPTVRGTSYVTASGLSTFSLPIPVAAVAGDFAVITGGGGFDFNTPSGWTANSTSVGSNWNGAVFSKVLTSADITAASVSVSATGGFDAFIGMTVFTGATGGIREVDPVRSSAGAASISVSTSSAVTATDTLVYFGSNRAVSTDTVSRGTLKQQANDGSAGAGCIYTEALSAGGVQSATFSFSTAGGGYYAAIVAVKAIVSAPILPTLGVMTTQGDIIVAGANAAPTRVPADISGKVWTSNGVGATPSWQTPAGGGGSLVLLESHTASSSTELDFTAWYSSFYDEYEIHFIGINSSTNGGAAKIQFSTNGGTSYDTSAIYDWGQANCQIGGGGTGGNVQGSVSGIIIFADSAGVGASASATPGLAAVAKLYDPASTTNYKFVSADGVGQYNGNGNRYSFKTGGVYRNTAAVNALRIIMTTGNIASGTVRIYGVAH